MAQPIKNIKKIAKNSRASNKNHISKREMVSNIIKRKMSMAQKPHPKYGTSKLEKRFAEQFLDKLGIEYQYQYEAKDIKRYYDFYLPTANVLVELDGDYW